MQLRGKEIDESEKKVKIKTAKDGSKYIKIQPSSSEYTIVKDAKKKKLSNGKSVYTFDN